MEEFEWSQEYENVNITIPLPQGTRPKDLKIQFTKNHISVKIISCKPPKTLVDGELINEVIPGDCYWQIEDQKELELVLEKKSNDFWKSVFVGGKEVDVSDREPTMTSSELSSGARRTIEEMLDKAKKN